MQHPKTRGGATRPGTKPKNSGPKGIDQRAQRVTTIEIKHAGKGAELEVQVARLQEELKNSKNQLSESESRAKQAQHEAREAKKELAAMTAKLDELWACEESRIQELRKVSQDRDRAWESELQAVQKHLTNAINENQNLNTRLQKVCAESEAAQAKQAESAHEVLSLREELSKTVNVTKEIETQLHESKDSESRALEELERVKSSMEECRNNEARQVEELGAALAGNVEMESELRRLKAQMEQWRKAAEVATAMVLGDDGGGGGGDGKVIGSVEPFDFNFVGEKSNLAYSEDAEDESSVKKTSNVLKKIGVLLKKGQK